MADQCGDPLVCSLELGLGVVAPVATVLISLAIFALRRQKGVAGVFSRFVSEDDLEEERLVDAAAAGSKAAAVPLGEGSPDAFAASESTPLLGTAVIKGRAKAPRWTVVSVALVVIGVVEFAARVAFIVRAIVSHHDGGTAFVSQYAATLATLGVWLYAALLPLLSPPQTPAFSLFAIYICSALATVIESFFGFFPGVEVISVSNVEHAAALGHILLCLVGIVIIWSLPMRVTTEKPVPNDEGVHPALDDFSTLGQWATVSWLNPLIARGKQGPLEETDIWQLAVDLRSRVLLRKFNALKGVGLMKKLILANARDLFAGFVLTILGALLSFAQPFLLHKILLAMEESWKLDQRTDATPIASTTTMWFSLPHTALHILSADVGLAHISADANPSAQEARRAAYLFAVVAFVCQLLKAQNDLQSVTTSRRAVIRAKSEVIASVYQKALRRIDSTGVVDAVNAKAKSPSGEAAAEKGVKGKGKGKEAGKGSGGVGGIFKAPAKDVRTADMGKLTSLVATDVNRLSQMVNVLNAVWDTPLAIVLACWFLFSLMGISGFVGYLVFILVIPANYLLIKWQLRLFRVILDMRDRRMRSINQLIQSIKFIKFSAWERKWIKRVMTSRETELSWLLWGKMLGFLSRFVWDVVPILIACINLSFFTIVMKKDLTVAIAFPAILTFSNLSSELTSIPTLIGLIGNVYQSFVRIEEFLMEDEVPVWVSAIPRQDALAAVDLTAPFDDRLGCDGATFQWSLTSQRKKAGKPAPEARRWLPASLPLFRNKTAPAPTPASTPTPEDDAANKPFELRDINVLFPRGKMSLICGATGSGKSSLLSALLGEMKCLTGKVMLPKTPTRVDSATGLVEGVSYCAQHPWLESKSIKENILFGSWYDKERYDAVLDACALVQDLTILEDADETEIGEKGIVLSGGQKARVALARAIYARTKTVILDDVLSAVDTHTAATLIRQCFLGRLMKDRTLVLITHHVDSVIAHCALIVKMENGGIEFQGTVDELRATGELASISKSDAGLKDHGEETAAVAEKKDEAGTENAAPAKALVEKETKASGSVRTKVYHEYLKACSYWILALMLFLLAFDKLSDLVQKFWIKTWSESYAEEDPDWRSSPFHFPPASQGAMPYVIVYLSIQLANAVSSVISQVPSSLSSLRASRILFRRMLESVVRSPTRWFDRTPAGRILNRFAKDIDTIDGGLAFYIKLMTSQLLSFTIAVGTIAYGIPPFMVAMVFILYMHWYFASGYIKSCRDLNRLESTSRSPIISAFGELLVGISTIRAFSSEKRFMDLLFKRLDKFQAAFYYTWVCNFWLRFRFNVLGSFTFLATTLITLWLRLDPGLAAIVITQSQGVLNTIYWGLRGYIEAETSFNSVERIAEYLELKPEPPRFTNKRPPPEWPSSGGISYNNVVIKYAKDLEPVLRGVSFTIKPGEKVGLVGRTGSGKSTLAMSLFRFVDPEQGTISIDSIDITSIGVEDLRSRLTLIPQDAVLFSGTIRENLDPFEEFTDDECLEVLRKVQLPVEETEEGSPPSSSNSSRPATPALGAAASQTVVTLQSKVSEGGANWSAGQRQLIALARALLRRTHIVVLDESTASVDFQTDKKIQHTIREEFRTGILLTIAHRLHTVIDYDRILVLDQGQVVEFGTPAELIMKEDGTFRSMCLKGDSFEELKEIALRNAA